MPTYTEVTTDAQAPWRSQAACHAAIEKEPILLGAWDTEDHIMGKQAKSICVNECEVRMSCLADAMGDPNSYGLRGGYFFDHGAVNTSDWREMGKTLGIQAKKRQKTRVSRAKNLGSTGLPPVPVPHDVVDLAEFAETHHHTV